MKDSEDLKIAYEPHLFPPVDLMSQEGVDVIEEWFRWAEELYMILKVYGNITRNSRVLEIGCGLGRTDFPLRYILLNVYYKGFEICHNKIDFLQNNFHSAYPNFNFTWATSSRNMVW